jgi:hypothetical protein
MVLARQGKHYFYKPPGSREPLEFWAQNGMVCIIDQRFPPTHDKAYIVLTTKEFLQNIRGINRAANRIAHQVKVALNSGLGAGVVQAEERRKVDKLVEESMACVREAWKQGSPDNPRHIEQMLRERRKSMLYAGATESQAGNGSGAKSQDIAPEAALLPPLILPGSPKARMPKRAIILP